MCFTTGIRGFTYLCVAGRLWETMKNYITKSEKINYCVGLSGQNLVYSLIGASFFTYFMTDIALFPAIIVSALLIVMKVWDGINDPVVGSFIDKHTFKNGEKMRPFLRYTPLPVGVLKRCDGNLPYTIS